MKKLLNLKINTKTSGYFAEWLCRMYMRFKGYRIIAKNYVCGSGKKTSCGELDFIATRDNKLVFCEVKKRRYHKDFLRALSYKQQQRILNGGTYFIMKNPRYRNFSVQFDVFFVKFPFYIRRISNAFYSDKY